MTKRVQLEIDEISHHNNVVFHIHRDTASSVDETDPLIMKVSDEMASRVSHTEVAEKLSRDANTHYAFYTKRHYKTDPLPLVYVDGVLIEQRNVMYYPEEKLVEITSGEFGPNDNKVVTMTYRYESFDILDDSKTESGKEYFGPPADGLWPITEIKIVQNEEDNRIEIYYTVNRKGKVYYYRIQAHDTEGNLSPLSTTKFWDLKPDVIYIRIQRSKNGEDWEEVALSNMDYWYDEVVTADNPFPIHDLKVTPINSKESKVSFINPWNEYKNYSRTSYQYRIRAEDEIGVAASEWRHATIEQLFIRPQSVLIRRKVDNGKLSTVDGLDAFDILTLFEKDINVNDERIEVIDNQLIDATVYGYTLFQKDQLDLISDGVYATSDHRPWKNVILFKRDTKKDPVKSEDFLVGFQLAHRIIEIGTK